MINKYCSLKKILIRFLEQQLIIETMNIMLRASVYVNGSLNGLFIVMPSSANFKNIHQQMFLIYTIIA